MKPILPFLALTIALGGVAFGTTVSTSNSALIDTVEGLVRAYAIEHNGELPRDWSDLADPIYFEVKEREFGVRIDESILLLTENPIPIIGDNKTLVAVTSFRIEQDIKDSIGRYYVYRDHDGKFASSWISEQQFLDSVKEWGGFIPSAPLAHASPIRPLYPEYATKIFLDAKRIGVSDDEASSTIQAHVARVLRGDEKPAETWAELKAARLNTGNSRPEISSERSNTAAKSIFSNFILWVGVSVLAMVVLLLWVVRNRRRL